VDEASLERSADCRIPTTWQSGKSRAMVTINDEWFPCIRWREGAWMGGAQWFLEQQNCLNDTITVSTCHHTFVKTYRTSTPRVRSYAHMRACPSVHTIHMLTHSTQDTTYMHALIHNTHSHTHAHVSMLYTQSALCFSLDIQLRSF
jgi:hypothetical protein